MGGVYGVDAGHGGESQREHHLDGGDFWGRGDSIDPERKGFFAGMVAGREDDCVYFRAKRRRASVFAFDGRRRAASSDETFDGRGFGDLVAGWEMDCVYLGRISGMQGRRMQQKEGRREGKKQSQGARGGGAALSPLDTLE